MPMIMLVGLILIITWLISLCLADTIGGLFEKYVINRIKNIFK